MALFDGDHPRRRRQAALAPTTDPIFTILTWLRQVRGGIFCFLNRIKKQGLFLPFGLTLAGGEKGKAFAANPHISMFLTRMLRPENAPRIGASNGIGADPGEAYGATIHILPPVISWILHPGHAI